MGTCRRSSSDLGRSSGRALGLFSGDPKPPELKPSPSESPRSMARSRLVHALGVAWAALDLVAFGMSLCLLTISVCCNQPSQNVLMPVRCRRGWMALNMEGFGPRDLTSGGILQEQLHHQLNDPPIGPCTLAPYCT